MIACPGESEVVLVTVEGRTFRQRSRLEYATSTSTSHSPSTSLLTAQQHSQSLRVYEDESIDSDDTLPQVPNQFMGLIIGKQGKSKQSIEQLSGAKLTLPAKNSVDDKVTIRGPSRKAVLQAYERINIIVAEARRKAQYTHFISLPLGTDVSLRDSTLKLQNEFIRLAAEKAVQGFDPSIVMPPSQMHLTVLMLKLLTQEEICIASDLLQSLASKIYDILETRSLVVNVRGLEIMNDDPSSCDVLYVTVNETQAQNRLKSLCSLILSSFESKGLADDSQQSRPVKLHATLFNSRYRQGGHDSTQSQRISFDARPFLALSNRADLGTVRIDSVQLSQRGANDSNGYYRSVAKVKLP